MRKLYLTTGNIANDPNNFLHPVTQNGRRKRQSDDFQPLFFEDLNITEAHRAICNNNSECILDLIASGDESLALATLEFETETVALQEELGECSSAILLLQRIFHQRL